MCFANFVLINIRKIEIENSSNWKFFQLNSGIATSMTCLNGGLAQKKQREPYQQYLSHPMPKKREWKGMNMMNKAYERTFTQSKRKIREKRAPQWPNKVRQKKFSFKSLWRFAQRDVCLVWDKNLYDVTKREIFKGENSILSEQCVKCFGWL